LNLLAKVHDLKVIARTSSFAFKGKNEDIRIIGQTLGVNTVLEGSVRKAGERVRITAQLINVADGAHLWSETYDRTLNDIFAVQDDVAAEILDALQIHVSAAPKRGRPTQNTEAYTLFLKARAAMNSSSYPEAEAFLKQSIALDPKFAEAHELLAYAHWWLSPSDFTGQQRRSLNAAADALAIDPSLLFAQALLVDAEGASSLKLIEAHERVLRQKPSHVGAMDILAYMLVSGGYFREAEALAQRFVEIDPLSSAAQGRLIEALGAIGRVDECLAAVDAARHLNRETGLATRSWCVPHNKRAESALAATESYLQREGLPTDLIQELAAGASDPTTGPALLDRLIPLIVAQISDETAWLVSLELHGLYLSYGFLDRYYEIIDPASMGGTEWNDTELFVYQGQLFRQSGFTTHPRHLELAEAYGLIELWDQRGAPDHCEKVEGLWVCE
jgi:tetratricopeptide (TPR) repeat protein